MFVLIDLILVCQQRLLALVVGNGRSTLPFSRAEDAPQLVAFSQQYPLAPVPAPLPRLTI